MKLAVRVTAGLAPDNYHGCSTRETSQAQEMTVITKGKKANRFKVSKMQDLDEKDVVIIELSQGSDLGYSKREGQATVPKWDFSTTPCPKYTKPRHRHGALCTENEGKNIENRLESRQ